MGMKIGVLVSRRLDVPNFLKDLPRILKPILKVGNDLQLLLEELSKE